MPLDCARAYTSPIRARALLSRRASFALACAALLCTTAEAGPSKLCTSGARFFQVTLKDVDLRDVDLGGAFFSEVRFGKPKLAGARLQGANLSVRPDGTILVIEE